MALFVSFKQVYNKKHDSGEVIFRNMTTVTIPKFDIDIVVPVSANRSARDE